MEKKFELFRKTIIKLGNAGILQDIILIGSWCLYLYRTLFKDADSMPAIRTLDLDFLIPNPPKISRRVNVAELLEELGFIEELSYISGKSKFIHPDLEVEFLIPEKGRGQDTPHIIKDINIRAQGMRYVIILQDHTITVPFEGFTIRIPEPTAYVLHKLQISEKRKSKEKKVKDIEAAIGLGEYLITRDEQVQAMRNIMNTLPVKWKKEILEIAKKNSEDIYVVLKDA